MSALDDRIADHPVEIYMEMPVRRPGKAGRIRQPRYSSITS
jgi:hypothetical protein